MSDTITVEFDNGNVVIHDILCDRKLSITLEQAYDIATAIGFMLQDLDYQANPETIPGV